MMRGTHKAHRHNTQTPPPSPASIEERECKHLRGCIYAAAFTVQPTQSTLIYVFDDGESFCRHFVVGQFEVLVSNCLQQIRMRLDLMTV